MNKLTAIKKLLNVDFTWTFISGILIGTSYIPFPPWALLFCFAPLFISIFKTVSIRRAFFLAWVCQFTFTLIGFHWIAHTAQEFGHLPQPVSWLILLVFCSFSHLHYPLAISFFVFLRKKVFKSTNQPASALECLFILPLTLACFEFSWPMLFPFHMAYALMSPLTFLSQWADIGGFQTLSLVLYVFNAAVAFIILKTLTSQFSIKKAGAYFTSLMFVLVLLDYGGRQRQNGFLEMEERAASAFHVQAVQANVGNFEKIYAEKRNDFRSFVLQKYLSLSKALPKSQVIVWPESAFPDNLDQWALNRPLQQSLIQHIQEQKTNFLIGGYSEPEYGIRKVYTTIFHFNESGTLTSQYNKRTLLAFGEYFPFGDTFPILYKLFPEVSRFQSGTDLGLTRIQNVLLGFQICYEGLFPDLTAQTVQKGAQILINVTNDSWYGQPFEPLQHMTMTLARALEVRRPLVRVTNTGITTAILASGRQLNRSPTDQEWVHVFEIPLAEPVTTLFQILSRFLPLIFWLSLGVLCLIKIWIGRKPSSP